MKGIFFKRNKVTRFIALILVMIMMSTPFFSHAGLKGDSKAEEAPASTDTDASEETHAPENTVASEETAAIEETVVLQDAGALQDTDVPEISVSLIAKDADGNEELNREINDGDDIWIGTKTGYSYTIKIEADDGAVGSGINVDSASITDAEGNSFSVQKTTEGNKTTFEFSIPNETTCTYQISDLAGNSISRSLEIKIDDISPSLGWERSDIYDENGDILKWHCHYNMFHKKLILKAQATDDNAIDKVYLYYKLCGNGNEEYIQVDITDNADKDVYFYDATDLATDLEMGQYDYYFVVTDKAGNKIKSQEHSVYIDKNPPEITTELYYYREKNGDNWGKWKKWKTDFDGKYTFNTALMDAGKIEYSVFVCVMANEYSLEKGQGNVEKLEDGKFRYIFNKADLQNDIEISFCNGVGNETSYVLKKDKIKIAEDLKILSDTLKIYETGNEENACELGNLTNDDSYIDIEADKSYTISVEAVSGYEINAASLDAVLPDTTALNIAGTCSENMFDAKTGKNKSVVTFEVPGSKILNQKNQWIKSMQLTVSDNCTPVSQSAQTTIGQILNDISAKGPEISVFLIAKDADGNEKLNREIKGVNEYISRATGYSYFVRIVADDGTGGSGINADNASITDAEGEPFSIQKITEGNKTIFEFSVTDETTCTYQISDLAGNFISGSLEIKIDDISPSLCCVDTVIYDENGDIVRSGLDYNMYHQKMIFKLNAIDDKALDKVYLYHKLWGNDNEEYIQVDITDNTDDENDDVYFYDASHFESGVYDYYFVAIDEAGNEITSKEKSIIVIRKPPVITTELYYYREKNGNDWGTWQKWETDSDGKYAFNTALMDAGEIEYSVFIRVVADPSANVGLGAADKYSLEQGQGNLEKLRISGEYRYTFNKADLENDSVVEISFEDPAGNKTSTADNNNYVLKNDKIKTSEDIKILSDTLKIYETGNEQNVLELGNLTNDENYIDFEADKSYTISVEAVSGYEIKAASLNAADAAALNIVGNCGENKFDAATGENKSVVTFEVPGSKMLNQKNEWIKSMKLTVRDNCTPVPQSAQTTIGQILNDISVKGPEISVSLIAKDADGNEKINREIKNVNEYISRTTGYSYFIRIVADDDIDVERTKGSISKYDPQEGNTDFSTISHIEDGRTIIEIEVNEAAQYQYTIYDKAGNDSGLKAVIINVDDIMPSIRWRSTNIYDENGEIDKSAKRYYNMYHTRLIFEAAVIDNKSLDKVYLYYRNQRDSNKKYIQVDITDNVDDKKDFYNADFYDAYFYDATGFEIGEYNYYFAAMDKAGNEITSDVEYIAVVKTPPAVTEELYYYREKYRDNWGKWQKWKTDSDGKYAFNTALMDAGKIEYSVVVHTNAALWSVSEYSLEQGQGNLEKLTRGEFRYIFNKADLQNDPVVEISFEDPAGNKTSTADNNNYVLKNDKIKTTEDIKFLSDTLKIYETGNKLHTLNLDDLLKNAGNDGAAINKSYTISVVAVSGYEINAASLDAVLSDNITVLSIVGSCGENWFDVTAGKNKCVITFEISGSEILNQKNKWIKDIKLTVSDNCAPLPQSAEITLGQILYDISCPRLESTNADDEWHKEFSLEYKIASEAYVMEGETLPDTESGLSWLKYTITNSNNNFEGQHNGLKGESSYENFINDVPESLTPYGTVITFKAEDRAGNGIYDSENANMVVVKVDKTDPRITSLTVNNTESANHQAIYSGRPVIKAVANDNLTLDKVVVEVVYPDGITRGIANIINKEAYGEGGIAWTTNYTVEVVNGKVLDGEYTVRTYAVDKAGRQSVLQNTTFRIDGSISKIQSFVSRLYDRCLNRTADDEGMATWTDMLASKKGTGASVAKGFVYSKEYIGKNVSDEEYLNMLYRVFLDREADAEGRSTWLDLMEQGLSRDYVFRGFVESPEYTNICQIYGIERGNITFTQPRDKNPNMTKFVNRLYVYVLGRNGEADGLNDWCLALQNKLYTPVQLGNFLVLSNEFKAKNLSDEEYIKVLYRAYLGRGYDEEGLATWLNLLRSGTSRETVLRGFTNSIEFRRIINSFGL